MSNPLAAPTEAAPPAEATPVAEAAPATEAATVNLKDLMGEDLTFKENVFEKMTFDEGENPDKYKALGDKFNSVGSLAKSYLNLERMLSKDKMPIPTENDGDEVWDQAYRSLGRPETPDGYEAPEGLPPEAKEATDKIFHEAGLSQKQASKLYTNIAQALEQNTQSQEESSQASVEAAIQSMESEFGPRGGDAYQQALDKAQTVAQHLGLDTPEFWGMPGFAGKLASQYETLMGSKVIGVDNGRIGSSQSIDDQIRDIQTNPSNPHYTAYRDGDPAIHKRVLQLFERKAELELG